MVLSHGQGTVKTRIMQIRREIFQGDSLSPLSSLLYGSQSSEYGVEQNRLHEHG